MNRITRETFLAQKNDLQNKTDRLRQDEIVQFRLDRASLLALHELAAEKQQRLGTLLREWVLERARAEPSCALSKVAQA
jgi:hypothetical protein